MIYNHKVKSNSSVLNAVHPPTAKESRSQCLSNGGKAPLHWWYVKRFRNIFSTNQI